MSFLEFLAGLGAAQGLLLLVLIGLRFRHYANLPLALLVLVFSLRLGTIPSWNPETLLRAPWLWPITTPLPFLFGPLLWWFIRNISTGSTRLPRPSIVYLVPYISETAAVAITVIGMDFPEYKEFVLSVFAGSPPHWLPIRNALKVAVNALCLVFAFRTVFGKDGRNLAGHTRLWLQLLVVLPSLVLVAFAFVAVNPPANARLAAGGELPFLILAAAMAILVYVISLLALAAPQLLAGYDRAFTAGRSKEPHISDQDSQLITEQIRKAFDAGVFLDSRLSLRKLAKRIDIHPNRVSYVVNHVYKQSFCSLVNDYRLQYFRERIEEGALNNHSILELALEAGFSSKSTFNRVFKETTGLSPSEYARRHETEWAADS
ncbi:AraC family transcriptional regulator [Marispirochaeta aestuarii]|uniref:helix-turn-helix domain-containing protein n=1 Tax=Marispirochaeta aestuarii TaxID=1963862 RepID=UPI0029C97941|nr:AraC family transcriptional regulator [Marispirochaeta aestuarii]